MDASLNDWITNLNWILMFAWMGIALYHIIECRRLERALGVMTDLNQHLMAFYMASYQGHVRQQPVEDEEAA